MMERLTYEVRLIAVPLKPISNRPWLPSHERVPDSEVPCVSGVFFDSHTGSLLDKHWRPAITLRLSSRLAKRLSGRSPECLPKSSRGKNWPIMPSTLATNLLVLATAFELQQ